MEFFGTFDTPFYVTLDDAQNNQDNPIGFWKLGEHLDVGVWLFRRSSLVDWGLPISTRFPERPREDLEDGPILWVSLKTTFVAANETTGIGVFDAPLFAADPAEFEDVTTETVAGSLYGQYFPAGDTSIGNWAFLLGDDVGQGNVTNTVTSEDPFVITWELCPLETKNERMIPDSFYLTEEDALAAGADPCAVDVAGAVQGQYYEHGNNAWAGDWSFTWSTGDSLIGCLGWGELWTPNVALGGTGVWSGFKGTIDNVVVSEDPFVIECNICPFEAEPDECC
ncbi:expressed unknown protein [Seminavis robusta]|uniref:Uncharacterized protein n=1 Tax=Seminavis robusta TaxID=568900 RepID=A0A9N8HMS5_9STRA|nr:expressed unknown protein [Seminavis robusta]|eukprot:Sro927_g221200.1 n/a (281) ;mRNA; f:39073-40230